MQDDKSQAPPRRPKTWDIHISDRAVTESRPRGILKHSSTDGVSRDPGSLTWDEQNLHYNEDHKDAKMKISEPKTPYVRYDAETDTVMDLDQIPGLELGTADDAPPLSAGSTASSRHSSFSSRSNSTSLPGSRRSSDSGEKRVDIVLDETLPAGGLPSTSDEEDENKWDEATRIKHTVFKNMRKNHYQKEGLVMSRKTPVLDDEDDEEEDQGTHSEEPPSIAELNAQANAHP